jgi:hypothetical protein
MSVVMRWLMMLGAVLLAVSFLLPFGSLFSGLGAVRLCVETARGSSGWVSFVWAACGLGMVYPYAWAAWLALTLFPGRRRPGGSPWPHLVFHTVGGSLLMAAAATLLVVREVWPAPWIQWTALGAPAVFLALMWTLARIVAPARKTWVVIVAGSAPLVPTLAVLVQRAVRYDNPARGFALGAAGAFFVLLGAIAAIRRPAGPESVSAC